MKKHIIYILLIVVLFIIILLQRKNEKIVETIKTDTITILHEIHDTITSKPVFIKGKNDTTWMTKIEYVPSENCDSLLNQYKKLGNEFFATNVYATDFPIKEYGKITVVDTIKENSLFSSHLITKIVIPEKIVTIEKPQKPKRQFYAGIGVVGNPSFPINGAQAGIIYKDKKDRMLGANVGWMDDCGMYYGISSYWKIKIKK